MNKELCHQCKERISFGHSLFCEICAVVWFRARSRAVSKTTVRVRHGEILAAKFYSCIDCGNPAAHYDHRDYSKPKEVVPVCRLCNIKRGPAVALPDSLFQKIRRSFTVESWEKHLAIFLFTR